MKVYVKLHVFVQFLVETLLVVVGKLKCELSPKRHEDLQQQTAQSQVQHGESCTASSSATCRTDHHSCLLRDIGTSTCGLRISDVAGAQTTSGSDALML